MKFLTGVVFAIVMAFASQAKAHTSIGAVGTYPELGGVYVSYFPQREFSVDGWLTLSTVDAGVSGHIPVSSDINGTHAIVLTGLFGYSHDLLPVFDYRSFHAVGAAGYGYLSSGGWDTRIQAGVTTAAQPHGLSTGFHGHLMVGHTL